MSIMPKRLSRVVSDFWTAVRPWLWVALVPALVLVYLADSKSFERLALEATVQEAEQVAGRSICPISPEILERGSELALEYCVSYGLTGWEDATVNPEAANAVYGSFGQYAEFQRARVTHGPRVTSIVYKYMVDGSRVANLKNQTGVALAKAWEDYRTGGLAAIELPEGADPLTAEELGIYALLQIDQHQETFLAQFEHLSDGTVKRRPVEAALQSTLSALLGGVRKVERGLLRGETLTAADWGSAALDVAVVYSVWLSAKHLAGKTALKGTAVGAKSVVATTAAGSTKAAVITAKSSRLVMAGALLVKGSRLTVLGVTVATGYMLYTDPVGLAEFAGSSGAWVAKGLGYPEWAGQGAGYFILWMIIWFIFWPIRFLWSLVPAPIKRRLYRVVGAFVNALMPKPKPVPVATAQTA